VNDDSHGARRASGDVDVSRVDRDGEVACYGNLCDCQSVAGCSLKST